MSQTDTISRLPNLGPKSSERLALAGIDSLGQLHQMGAVSAYLKVRGSSGQASLNLLSALEGALTGLPWQAVARKHRSSLLLALDDQQRAAR